jgi:N-acyl homoserine lactone hydrolase
MKIHAIQTGTVALTTSWREGVGHGRRRLLNTLLDRQWTDPLPIYAFAIEHPEGVIVVDTGETARVAEPGYFPRWSPSFASQCASKWSGMRRSARSSSGSGSGLAISGWW